MESELEAQVWLAYALQFEQRFSNLVMTLFSGFHGLRGRTSFNFSTSEEASEEAKDQSKYN